MLSGGVIIASCAGNDNGKTSSIAAVSILLGIILIMVAVPLLLRRLLLYPKQLDTQEKWRELAQQRAC